MELDFPWGEKDMVHNTNAARDPKNSITRINLNIGLYYFVNILLDIALNLLLRWLAIWVIKKANGKL